MLSATHSFSAAPLTPLIPLKKAWLCPSPALTSQHWDPETLGHVLLQGWEALSPNPDLASVPWSETPLLGSARNLPDLVDGASLGRALARAQH
jgi:hypothetical protein